MQLTARLTQRLADVTGQGNKGPWTRHQVVVTTEGQYAKEVLIDAYENKGNAPINTAQLGDLLRLDVDLESKKYGNKYYTSVKAHKIEILADPVGQPKSQRPSVATQPPMPRPAKPARTYTPDPQSFDDGDDSLPF